MIGIFVELKNEIWYDLRIIFFNLSLIKYLFNFELFEIDLIFNVFLGVDLLFFFFISDLLELDKFLDFLWNKFNFIFYNLFVFKIV